jgi:hypothetical protein
VHARLTYLCELHPTDARLVKYDRAHELECFDAIHMKSEFKEKFTAAEFPLLPSRVRSAPRNNIDLDNDSDAELGLDFYQDSTTPNSAEQADTDEQYDVLDDRLDRRGNSAEDEEEDDSEGEGVMPDGLQMIKVKKSRATKAKAKPRRVVATDSDEEDEVI